MSSSSDREVLDLALPADLEPLVGNWLAAHADCRARTLAIIEQIPDGLLDVDHPMTGNSIGTLLYHIALIEADWLYVEVLEQGYPPDMQELFPYEDRDANGRLTPVYGATTAEHLLRLRTIREQFVTTYAQFDAEELARPRHLEHYDVTPAWVANHLLQHEAGHRVEIEMLIDWFNRDGATQ